MASRSKKHTPMGRKIAAIAGSQAEIAKVLGLTQQSISGKMTGKIAITVKDLEMISAHYSIPMIYFVSPEIVTVEATRAYMKMLAGPPETIKTMEIATSFDRSFACQLYGIVQSMRVTASYSEDVGKISAPVERTKTAEA